MSERTDKLMDAGMQFDPTPPSPEQEAEIEKLTPAQFEQLLDLAGTLDNSPLFLSFNQGLQKRSYEEP
jgi:hypothetical protein